MFATIGSRRFAIALAVLTATAFALLYLARNPRWFRPPRAAGSRPNVVLILVDTLRADHLSLYGYPRVTSPRLDRLARERGVVLENVRSQAPCTFPSVNSLLTSREPHEFVGRRDGDFSIPPELPTIATMLAAGGFETAAVSASPVVRATPSRENPVGGFAAGFSRFDESCNWDFARCVNDRASGLLDELEPPFFLYLHYMDPHDPYVLPGARNVRFSGAAPPGSDRAALLAGDVDAFAARLYGPAGEAGLDRSELDFLIGRYDESIRYWDSWFGELMDELERRGLAAETIVVVASDHGEEFLEHGHLKHCRNVFDTTVRVPLVFFAPGAAARRLRIPASNLDVVPTLLDLVSVGAGAARFAGGSLRPWLTGATDAPRPSSQYSWWGEHRSLSDGLHKLVYSTRTRAISLYRLDRDPEERSDVSGEQRRVAALLASELQRRLSEDPTVADGAGDDALSRQLKALGYLQ